jgi:hypothetical protein
LGSGIDDKFAGGGVGESLLFFHFW